jgi:hypothetical protein
MGIALLNPSYACYRLKGLRGTPGVPSLCSFAPEQFNSFLSRG